MPDPLEQYTQGLLDITQRPTKNTLVGGPDYYDPALGRLAVTNPEMLAQLLDAKGLRAPPDVSKDFTHRDASQALLNATVQAKQGGGEFPTPSPGGRTLDPSWGALPGVGVNPNEAAQTTSIVRPPAPPMPEPGRGMSALPPTGDALNPVLPPPSGSPFDIRTWLAGGGSVGASPEAQGPPQGTPTTGGYRRSSQDVSGPTPSPESVNSSGAVPAPATAEKPGDLSKPDPTMPSGMRMSRGAGPGDQVHPDKTVDGLAKALAGLQGMTPKPFLPSTPAPYHASGQIARGTLPQALLAEMVSAGHPAKQFRLGEALRGRSYA